VSLVLGHPIYDADLVTKQWAATVAVVHDVIMLVDQWRGKRGTLDCWRPVWRTDCTPLKHSELHRKTEARLTWPDQCLLTHHPATVMSLTIDVNNSPKNFFNVNNVAEMKKLALICSTASLMPKVQCSEKGGDGGEKKRSIKYKRNKLLAYLKTDRVQQMIM